jgi:hypothetical protein
MKTLSPDTHPDAERIHIEMIRIAPIFQRLQMVTSLIKTTRQLSWRGICERYPHDTQKERIKRFMSLLYNDETLAERVAESMTEKGIRIDEAP